MIICKLGVGLSDALSKRKTLFLRPHSHATWDEAGRKESGVKDLGKDDKLRNVKICCKLGTELSEQKGWLCLHM